MAGAAATPWYTHRWNSERSWRLILGIVPRVPRLLRPALHLITTTIFFALLREERRAALRNLKHVTGRAGLPALLAAFRLFRNFSRFMVAYTHLPPYARPGAGMRVADRDLAQSAVRAGLGRGRGLIVATFHIGQWDAALVELARLGVPVTVVMRREEESAARFGAAVRDAAGLKVVPAGEDPYLGVGLLTSLRRGEIVALQVDRPYGGRNALVRLFGATAEIPAGPWELARASGAPILPAAAILEAADRIRIVSGGLIDPAEALDPREGPARIAGAIEALVGRHPEQWFNFYDVWAAPLEEGSKAGRREGAAA